MNIILLACGLVLAYIAVYRLDILDRVWPSSALPGSPTADAGGLAEMIQALGSLPSPWDTVVKVCIALFCLMLVLAVVNAMLRAIRWFMDLVA